MAITKTNFLGTTLEAQVSEVLTWLQANATAYFDTIEYNSETSCILCTVDGVVALELHFEHTTAALTKAFLKNGVSMNIIRNTSSTFLYKYAVSTSNGFALYLGESANYEDWIIITKNNNNDLYIALLGTVYESTASAGLNTTAFVTGDFENSFTFTKWVNGSSGTGAASVKNWLGTSAALTSLVPLVSGDCPTYTPNLFITRFSEHLGVIGKVIIGDTEYFSNGYIALKG